jgi:hypothetical protein
LVAGALAEGLLTGADEDEGAGDDEPDADDEADGATEPDADDEADGATEPDADGPADAEAPAVSEGRGSVGTSVSIPIEGSGVDGVRKPPFPNASAAKMIAPKITKMRPTQILSRRSSM